MVSWLAGSRLNFRGSFSRRYEILIVFLSMKSLRCISVGIIVKEVGLNSDGFLES